MVGDFRNGWIVIICFLSLLTGIFIISYELYIPFSTIPEDKSIREVLSGEEMNSLSKSYQEEIILFLTNIYQNSTSTSAHLPSCGKSNDAVQAY